MKPSKLTNPIQPFQPPQAAKQVVYVDVDDEITTIIDKMNGANARVVALVLPKRAAVFQSVVNMKLLKRRAESAKKNIVLITSEAGLMPLAGMAGVHIATTLQSKPEIPSVASAMVDDDDEEATSLSNDESEQDFDRDGNATKPVGALAGGAAVGTAASIVEDDVIDMSAASTAPKGPMPSAPKPPVDRKLLATAKDKNPKVPNFLRFRKRLILAGVAIVLLGFGSYFAFFVMPKATVTVHTNASDVDSRLAITLDTVANTVNDEELIVPAQTKQEQKSNTQSVPATGQENKGEKASGDVIMSATICGTPSTPPDVPAGTGISAKDQTFITQKNASFTFNGIGGGCIRFKTDAITVAAQKGGASFNLTTTDFAVAGRSDVKATGSTSGGTDNTVKVVQQADVDAAKQKLTSAQNEAALKKQLQSRLEEDGLYALPTTFFAGPANTNLSSDVGQEAATVTVTEAVTYTMFGVKQADLKKLIETDLKKKINSSKQSILDDGLAKARITVGTAGAGPQQKVDIALTATAGPKLDVAKLKQSITGLKTGEVEDRIRATPGVESVEAKYSPFWVTKAPKAEKITVQFEKTSAGTADDR